MRKLVFDLLVREILDQLEYRADTGDVHQDGPLAAMLSGPGQRVRLTGRSSIAAVGG
jgi:hypothetical protein